MTAVLCRQYCKNMDSVCLSVCLSVCSHRDSFNRGPLDRGSAEKQNVLPPKKSSVGNEELTRLPAEHSRTSMRKYASTESLVSLKDNDQASHYRPSTPTPRRKHSNRETGTAVCLLVCLIVCLMSYP